LRVALHLENTITTPRSKFSGRQIYAV